MENPDAWLLTESLHVKHGQADPFSAAIRATRMPMIVTDPSKPDNPIIFANDAFLQLTGYSRDDVTGRNCRFLQGPDTDPSATARIRQAVADNTDIAIDILNYKKDGTPFWNALYLSPVPDADGVSQYFFASQLDVSARKSAEATTRDLQHKLELRTKELEDALARSNLLLHEVDHRVKNNLQMVCSMITLQMLNAGSEDNKQLFNSLLERIEAISLMHKRLYKSDNLEEFDLGEFTREMAENLVLASGRADIELQVDAHSAPIKSTAAASAAIIVNEVITNALKHGFPSGKGGTLAVRIVPERGACEISVQDQGPGMPTEQAVKETFGKTLIETLIQDLRATIEWVPTLPGTLARIRLPLA